MRHISRQLYTSSRGTKCCTFFGLYHELGGRLEFVNGDHSPPLVLSNGGVRFLESTGVPLGLFPEVSHKTGRAILEPGTLVVMYSEGLTEARNPEGEIYGVDRLVQFVSRAAHQETAGLVDKILADVGSFSANAPVEDDRTLLLLKVDPA